MGISTTYTMPRIFNRIYPVVYWCLLIPAILLIDSCCKGEQRAALLFRNGTSIIHALDSYKVDNDAYPATLESLVPQYLEKIPPPAWGRNEWRYSLSDGVFRLEVLESQHSEYIGYSFFSDLNKWGYSSS